MLSCYDSTGEETTTSGHCWSVWNLVCSLPSKNKRAGVSKTHVVRRTESFVRLGVCPDPQTCPGSWEFPLVWSQHYYSTGSQQHHSHPFPFTCVSLTNMTQTSYYSVHLRPQKQPIHQYMAQYTRLPSVSVTCCAGAVYLETYLKSLCQKQLIV